MSVSVYVYVYVYVYVHSAKMEEQIQRTEVISAFAQLVLIF